MLLREFIKEYEEKFSRKFKDGFWGEIARISSSLKEPSLHPSKKLIEILDSFEAGENEPLKIAVIGQFSSGKSTLINTILGREILPSGVVPVTAKATYIKYAPNELLSVIYKDGRSEALEIGDLANFVDQRNDLKDIKNITIYANNELLKRVTFIDTPGLNSRNSGDTRETLRIFSEAHAVLWISLIDNAARASESGELELLPRILRENSLMILSQKDRLGSDDIERVLGHSRRTLGQFFSGIVPVSSKLEKSGENDSGFDEIYKFLNKLENSREKLAKDRLNEVILNLKSEREKYIKIYTNLDEIISKNLEIYNEFGKNLKIYTEEFSKFYAQIKELSSVISSTMSESLHSEKSSYFRKKSTIFGGENYEKIEYEAPFFNRDEALSKLIYNDTKMSDNFRRFKSRLGKFEERILSEVEQTYKKMENEVMLFKGRFESFSRDSEVFSIEEASLLNKIAGEVYELFLKNYEREIFEFSQSIRLFFEKIMIKIITNYENSIILTADFINNKILKSIDDYESDPLTFSLYYPKFEDFNGVLLNNLHYYEFENDFIGSSTFIKKALNKLENGIKDATNKNAQYIGKIRSRQEEALKFITNLAPK